MIGQIVQASQATMSKDAGHFVRHPRGMPAPDPKEREFIDSFTARVKALREAKGWSAETMADALRIPADRYRKYESRSPMPSYLIEAFALIVGRDVTYVLTGKSARPGAPPPPQGEAAPTPDLMMGARVDRANRALGTPAKRRKA